MVEKIQTSVRLTQKSLDAIRQVALEESLSQSAALDMIIRYFMQIREANGGGFPTAVPRTMPREREFAGEAGNASKAIYREARQADNPGNPGNPGIGIEDGSESDTEFDEECEYEYYEYDVRAETSPGPPGIGKGFSQEVEPYKPDRCIGSRALRVRQAQEQPSFIPGLEQDVRYRQKPREFQRPPSSKKSRSQKRVPANCQVVTEWELKSYRHLDELHQVWSAKYDCSCAYQHVNEWHPHPQYLSFSVAVLPGETLEQAKLRLPKLVPCSACGGQQYRAVESTSNGNSGIKLPD